MKKALQPRDQVLFCEKGLLQIKEQLNSPGINVAYRAPQGQFFMNVKLFIMTPICETRSSLKD